MDQRDLRRNADPHRESVPDSRPVRDEKRHFPDPVEPGDISRVEPGDESIHSDDHPAVRVPGEHEIDPLPRSLRGKFRPVCDENPARSVLNSGECPADLRPLEPEPRGGGVGHPGQNDLVRQYPVRVQEQFNAERLQRTCDRLVMPKISTGDFIDALDQLVKANLGYVPPYGSGATLYIRPFIYGCGPVIGVAPSPSYEFRMFCTPVGPYFKGGVKPIRIMLSDYDRAAPHGTGDIKAGLNYAMSLYAGEAAHKAGFSENMYLDAATRTYVEETGGANFIFITRDGRKVITPKSPSILPSITRRSLMVVARDYLGLEVEERPVRFDEVSSFAEVGLCGTAAVISPVGQIHTKDGDVDVPSGMQEMGPVLTRLRETITGIQMGEIEAPEGWIHRIC